MLNGQVCCSLVGTVNTGSSNVISAHFPANLAIDKKIRWNTGLLNSKNFNNGELIKYPYSHSGYIEISDYINNYSVWFINTSLSATSLNEKVSFDNTSTYVIGGKGQFGIRNKLNYGIGLIENSFTFPVKPYYTNQDFVFKTGVVPSYSFNWMKTRILDSVSNVQVGIRKNFKEKRDVFIDNYISLTFWREDQFFDFLISPYISLQHQKLIAPLTPFEDNRDSRLMSFIFIGMNLITLNQKFDFIQINLNVPIYSWVAEIGFPDGTIPSTSLSISFFSNGIFKKKERASIFN